MVIHPTTLKQALQSLQEAAAVPVAGGTDWMLPLNHCAKDSPVFIGDIKALQEVVQTETHLSIGACCTYAALQTMACIPSALRTAAHSIASPAIRNIATIGGNICNASPAGDTLPVLYALDASVELVSLNGSRILPIEMFITDRKKTALQKGELLMRILIPHHQGITWFHKVSARRAQALSKCSVAGLLHIEHSIVQDVRVAFGAVGLTIVRDKQIENMLRSQPLAVAKQLIPDMIHAYGTILSPIDDARSTAVYRRTVCLRLIEDFLNHNLEASPYAMAYIE